MVIPLPSQGLWSMLCSRRPLHGHLPSPGVFLVLVLARVLHPRRWVSVHWHSFLEPGQGLEGQMFARRIWLRGMRLLMAGEGP